MGLPARSAAARAANDSQKGICRCTRSTFFMVDDAGHPGLVGHVEPEGIGPVEFGGHGLGLVGVQVEDRRPAAPPSFDDSKEQLAADAQHDTIDTKIAELRGKAKVELGYRVTLPAKNELVGGNRRE